MDRRAGTSTVAVSERREREHAGWDVVVGHHRDDLEVGDIGADRVEVGEVVRWPKRSAVTRTRAPDWRRMNPTSFMP